MKDTNYYDRTYQSIADLPKAAQERVAPIILDRHDDGNEALFFELGESLPNTYRVLCDEYNSAVFGTILFEKRYIVDILIPHQTWYLRCDIDHGAKYEPGSRDRGYFMLPEDLRAYYFLALGIELVKSGDTPGFTWEGLPTSLGTRLTIEEFYIRRGISPKTLSRKIRNSAMFVWMSGTHRDLLLLDERSGQFYEGYIEENLLLKPVGDILPYWDRHCARVFSTGSVSEPLFRRGEDDANNAQAFRTAKTLF